MSQQDSNNPPVPEDVKSDPKPEAPTQEPSDNHVPYARFKEVNDQKKAMEDALKGVAEEMIEDIPEQFRGLVPEGLTPSEKISWMRKATRSGLFNGPEKASSPDVDRPKGKPAPDYDNMTPMQMRSMGYKS